MFYLLIVIAPTAVLFAPVVTPPTAVLFESVVIAPTAVFQIPVVVEHTYWCVLCAGGFEIHL